MRAGVNWRKRNGVSALHVASQNEKLGAVTAYLVRELGAVTALRSESGATALLMAALRLQDKVVRTLLECGADPDLEDNNGWTPPHAACNGAAPDAPAVVRMLASAPRRAAPRRAAPTACASCRRGTSRRTSRRWPASPAWARAWSHAAAHASAHAYAPGSCAIHCDWSFNCGCPSNKPHNCASVCYDNSRDGLSMPSSA